MALFKINRGNKSNLPTTITEGYMYITEDVGDIYVDISNSERIRLNAEAAEKIRKITYNDDGSKLLEVSLDYDDIKNLGNSVKQTSSTTSNYRALLMGYSHNATPSNLGEEEIGQAYKSTKIVACPSTGEIKATKFTGAVSLPYGECYTAAATAAKTVTVNNFSLEEGARVLVFFKTKSTAANPTLNVNNTGAKSIEITVGLSEMGTSYIPFGVYEFVYTSDSKWRMVSNVNTDRNVFQALCIEDGEIPILHKFSSVAADRSITNGVSFTSGVTINPSNKSITATSFNGTATKATQDGSGNVITDTYATKSELTNIKLDDVAYIDIDSNENIIVPEVPETPTNQINVDSALSTSSTNPVQNKIITDKFTELASKINSISNDAINLRSGFMNTATGSSITLNDAANASLMGMRVYGKTTIQAGEFLGVNNITVNVSGDNMSQSLSLDVGKQLHGIPVTSGGNYVDGNGQQWIADYADYGKGVIVQMIGYISSYNSATDYDKVQNVPWMSSTGGTSLTSGAQVLYALKAPYELPMGRYIGVIDFEDEVGRLSSRFAAGTYKYQGSQSLRYYAYGAPLSGGRDVKMQYINNNKNNVLLAGKYTVTFWAADPDGMVAGKANGNSKIIMTFHAPNQTFLFNQNVSADECGHYDDPALCAAYKELIDITGGQYLVEPTGKVEQVNGITWTQYIFDINLDRKIAAINFYVLQPNACTTHKNKSFYLDHFEIYSADDTDLNNYHAIQTSKFNTTISTGAYTEVNYEVDIKRYIDNKFAELSAAILKNE